MHWSTNSSVNFQASFILKRDKKQLVPGDRISKFMREIGRGGSVLVVLSEKYLRSTYCMGELLELYRSSQGEPEQFLNRIVVLTAENLKLSGAEDRLPVVLAWQEKARRLKDAISKVDPVNISAADRLEFFTAESLAHSASEILSWVGDTLMPRGSEGIDAAIRLLVERTPKQ